MDSSENLLSGTEQLEVPSPAAHAARVGVEGDGWVDWSGLATLLATFGIVRISSLARLLTLVGTLMPER
jgi:hypothetical protein